MYVVLLLTVFLGSSCDKIEDFVSRTFHSEDLLNVSYGTDTLNKMDVYLPAARGGNTKLVFLIHGGSWYSGDKSEFTEYATTLRSKGYAVVNLNYRLVNAAGTVKLQQQEDDLKAAIDYAYAKSEDWGVSNKIALVGASAGAHLAMLYTYANNADNKVKTVVSLAGPTNLTDTRNITVQAAGLVKALLGVSPYVNPQAYVDASPISKVNASSKPTLIFHGKKDVTVPVQQSIDLNARLIQSNIKSKLVIYENTGHEVVNTTNFADFILDLDTWLRENIN